MDDYITPCMARFYEGIVRDAQEWLDIIFGDCEAKFLRFHFGIHGININLMPIENMDFYAHSLKMGTRLSKHTKGWCYDRIGGGIVGDPNEFKKGWFEYDHMLGNEREVGKGLHSIAIEFNNLLPDGWYKDRFFAYLYNARCVALQALEEGEC